MTLLIPIIAGLILFGAGTCLISGKTTKEKIGLTLISLSFFAELICAVAQFRK